MHALVDTFFNKIWTGREDALIDTCLSEDFQFRGSTGITTDGRDGFRGYQSLFFTAFPDFSIEVIESVVQDVHAAVRVIFRGTHQGVIEGIEPTGQAIAYEGAAFLDFKDGKIQRVSVLGDKYSLLEQLKSARDS